jgi:Transposase IS4
MLAEIVENALCFLWQDNNAVLGITTAYVLKYETILRNRKRPSPTSTNARIVRPVFEDKIRKWPQNPLAIDSYNHHMNAVDCANQLRKNLTVHRRWERRVWRPQWFYILDICLVNSFLIWKYSQPSEKNDLHRKYQETLLYILINWPRESELEKKRKRASTAHDAPPHAWQQFPKRGYCIWGKEGDE